MAYSEGLITFDGMFCESCHKDGNTVRADGFCVNCLDYMCNTCLKYHRKYVRNHKQLDRSEMPQDYCVERCPVHPKELVKFYCTHCDDATCPECIPINHHASCTDIFHIPTYLQSKDINSEFKELKQALKEIDDEATRVKDETDENLKQVNSNRNEISKAISRHRVHLKDMIEDERIAIFKALDQEKEETIRKLEERQNQRKQQLFEQQKSLYRKIEEEARRMDEQSKTYPIIMQKMAVKSSKVMSKIGYLTAEIDKKERQGRRAELFIASKKIRQNVGALKKDINDVREESAVSYYHFRPNKNDISIDSPGNSITIGSLSSSSRHQQRRSNVSHAPEQTRSNTSLTSDL